MLDNTKHIIGMIRERDILNIDRYFENCMNTEAEYSWERIKRTLLRSDVKKLYKDVCNKIVSKSIEDGKKLKQYSLVRFTKDTLQIIDNPNIDNEIFKEKVFIFYGEIPNMPEHCIVSGHYSGKIYSGYHTSNFEEIPEDETWWFYQKG